MDTEKETSDDINMEELERLTGQPRRNIRFLISELVVPEARSRGRYATYGPEHVRALNVYTELKKEGIESLALIREVALGTEYEATHFVVKVPGAELRIETKALAKEGAESLMKLIGDELSKEIANRKGLTK